MCPKYSLLGVLVVLFLLAGCGTPTALFLQRGHRINYALQPQEVMNLQFYIDKEVLARREGATGQPAPEDVIVVPTGTPGVATEVGPDWVRVAFTKGGGGVVFSTVESRSGDSAYWLATELPQGGYAAVRHEKEKILLVRGVRYLIVHGYDARLLVNNKDLQKLIDSRTRAEGVTR